MEIEPSKQPIIDNPTPEPPPAATVVMTGERTERETQLEAELEAERKARKKAEMTAAEALDTAKQLTDIQKQSGLPKPQTKKPGGWGFFRDRE